MAFDSRRHADSDFSLHGISRPSEIDRASRTRRCEFLAGRRCARSALASLGCESAGIPIGPDGAPRWPQGYNGSISHSSSWAAAAASGAGHRRPGVDCESIVGATAFMDMANLVAARDELETAERILGDRNLALTVLFSAKESAYKSLDPGARAGCDFFSFRVLLANDDSATLQVSDIRPSLRMRTYHGLYRRLDPTTILTLVVCKDDLQGPEGRNSP